MAGNIIPAIATTNAVIAGLIVLQGMKILQEKFSECRTVYLNRRPNPRKRLLVPCVLDKPNTKCYVCSEKPEVCVQLNVEKITIKVFEERILKSALNMVAPDVEVMDGKGTIIISSEPGETEENNDKLLKDFQIVDGVRLNCDDFLQNYNLIVTIIHSETIQEGLEFNIIGDPEKLKADQEEAAKLESKEQNGVSEAAGSSSQGNSNLLSVVDDEDDLVCLDDVVEKKRKAEEELEESSKAKKLKVQEDLHFSSHNEIVLE